VTMSSGNGTPWGSAAGSGVEVEGAELLTFSAAAKVRVGEPGRAVVSDTAATQPAPPLSAFLPVVIGLDRQAAVLHPLEPRSTGRKLLGAAWVLVFSLAWK
ncbi:hypothetical protein EI555_021063, partial [Monodon monoceros]